MGIIPQDSFIFTGSIRANLDPKKLHGDEDLWDVLRETQLAEVVIDMGGLDKEIKPDSLSVGQNQLLCLARAVLHNAKVVCIDEATANLDEKTDQLIQITIQNHFKNSTVITIAHRIQTVMKCDRVLVIDKGMVVECDEPEKLLENPDSFFSRLSHESYN
ncbi:Hypothetical protein NTJ_11313 [Nesidiocoris tenuis]|uniref:ABC transporter domain-containing protein n=1 Tax=Nesidiocoris tenuis TaxID=355587 RepID=A0ABN7B6U8_9HEMI|nr:Hypothetical protein NTJ_11313 [Nesidiocoris tenuis]